LIHAWPVASLFLCSARDERMRGLREIVKQISGKMGMWTPVVDRCVMAISYQLLLSSWSDLSQLIRT
jgi:hypothetical protein